MKQTPPVIHFGDHGEEWEYDVAEIAYQLFGKRMNASMVRILGIFYSRCHAHNFLDHPLVTPAGTAQYPWVLCSTRRDNRCIGVKVGFCGVDFRFMGVT